MISSNWVLIFTANKPPSKNILVNLLKRKMQLFWQITILVSANMAPDTQRAGIPQPSSDTFNSQGITVSASDQERKTVYAPTSAPPTHPQLLWLDLLFGCRALDKIRHRPQKKESHQAHAHATPGTIFLGPDLPEPQTSIVFTKLGPSLTPTT